MCLLSFVLILEGESITDVVVDVLSLHKDAPRPKRKCVFYMCLQMCVFVFL